MINDRRYNEILKKYGISSDTPIENVRRILAVKLKEVHPDVNKASDALERSIEITNDRDYIISLMKKMKDEKKTKNQNQSSTNSGNMHNNYTGNNSQNKDSYQSNNSNNVTVQSRH